jgi:hypothetical protein
MNARVRPLLLFWIARENVGDAVIARFAEAGRSKYSLLIGSDPERAPRRINRWGYIEEDIRPDGATLMGLMTQSDEESVSEAEANLRTEQGQRRFKMIRASIADGESRSVVTSVPAPAQYSLRNLDAVLDLAAGDDTTNGRTRVLKLGSATRPGFLTAVAELMHREAGEWRSSRRVSPGEPIQYVYHGTLYRLVVSRTRGGGTTRIGGSTYEGVIVSEFRIENTKDGTATDFSMSYPADGPLAEMPLAITYKPRWWLEVQLALDDTTTGPPLAKELAR